MSWVNDLNGKIILITGGTGFAGKSLMDYLDALKLPLPPTVIAQSRGFKDISHAKWSNLKIREVHCDLLDLKAGMLDEKIDYVIHGATSTSVTESTNIDYLHKTVYLGTQNLLTLCQKIKPKGIIYLSSGAVYGLDRTEQIPISENDLGGPNTSDVSQSYGHFKRLAETLCSQFFNQTKIPITVLRCFAFSGKNLDPDGPFAVTNFLKNALGGDSIKITGNGLAIRSYMDGEDLAEWIFTLICKNKEFVLLNAGSDQAISIQDLAKVVADFTKVKVELLNTGTDTRHNYYVPDLSLAKTKYGLSLKLSLKKSIENMINFQRTKG